MSRTLREAAQMALDALLIGYHRGTHDAITALREALAAPEPEPVARCILDNGDEMGSVEWLVRPRSIRLDHGSLLYAAPVVPLTGVLDPDCSKRRRRHEASADCWCEPSIDYTDPDTGVSVYIHKEPQ